MKFRAICAALAVLLTIPAAALAGEPSAPPSERVAYGDLDLGADAGAVAMLRRISKAATAVCSRQAEAGSTADVMARCKGEPLTPQELADWKAWKVKHDREERQDTDQAVYRVAGENVADTLRNACHALDKGIVTYTEADGEELWELLDAFAKRLKKAGIERPSRPRGRPRAITIIEADDGGQTRWLPNFHPPGTPEHERYDEAMRRAGKKPGDPL